jgi:hypothetical protein
MLSKISGPHSVPPPDRPSEFDAPANDLIVEYFRKSADWNADARTYVLHAKPDLTSELYKLIEQAGISKTDIKSGSMYGSPIVANRNGVVFAWAGGTHDVFLRLSKSSADRACEDGARYDPT